MITQHSLPTDLSVSVDIDALYKLAASHWVNLARQAVATRGAFHVALAGGSTPRGLYQLLATPDYCERIAWAQTQIYFGDERAVPPDHADSNYRMAREALLQQVPIPAANIHRMVAHGGALAEGAARYQRLLETALPASANGIPQLDLLLLGIGPDGHIASLFPDTAILDEQHALVAPVYVDKFNSWRMSITFPVINNARRVMVLAAGESKASIIAELFGADGEAISAKSTNNPYPVQRIAPLQPVIWLLDSAAAQRIT